MTQQHVINSRGGVLSMCSVDGPLYNCSVETTTHTLQPVRGLYAVYTYKNSHTQMENRFSCTLQNLYEDKQTFSVCWTLEETGGDRICDYIRCVEIFRAPPLPQSLPYVH